jgi:hypothetical protein
MLGEGGDITFNYAGLDDDTERGLNAAVGMESPGGGSGLQYAFLQPILASGKAVRVDYPTNPRPIPLYTLSGTVTRGGTPVPNALVKLWPMDRQVRADASGRYSFSGLEPGGYTPWIVAGCEKAVVPVGLEADTVIDLPLATRQTESGLTCDIASHPFEPADQTVLPFVYRDDVATVSLPFDFTFYGQTYQQIHVAAWGVMGFSKSYMGWVSPNIYPCSLFVQPVGTLHPVPAPPLGWTVRTAVVGSGAAQEFIVEWRGIDFGTIEVTFEAILRPDGSITMNFSQIDTATERAKSARVNPPTDGSVLAVTTGAVGDTTSVLDNDRAITFRPSTP